MGFHAQLPGDAEGAALVEAVADDGEIFAETVGEDDAAAELQVFPCVGGFVLDEDALFGDALLQQVSFHDQRFRKGFVVALPAGDNAGQRRIFLQVFHRAVTVDLAAKNHHGLLRRRLRLAAVSEIAEDAQINQSENKTEQENRHQKSPPSGWPAVAAQQNQSAGNEAEGADVQHEGKYAEQNQKTAAAVDDFLLHNTLLCGFLLSL